jgi:hypothetical protein
MMTRSPLPIMSAIIVACSVVGMALGYVIDACIRLGGL